MSDITSDLVFTVEHSTPDDRSCVTQIPATNDPIDAYIHGPTFDARLAWSVMHIIAMLPSHWEQETWRRDRDDLEQAVIDDAKKVGLPTCGTSYCFAGFVSVLDERVIDLTYDLFAGRKAEDKVEDMARYVIETLIDQNRVLLAPEEAERFSSVAYHDDEYGTLRDAVKEVPPEVADRVYEMTGASPDHLTIAISDFAFQAIGLGSTTGLFAESNSYAELISELVDQQVASIPHTKGDEVRRAILGLSLKRMHAELLLNIIYTTKARMSAHGISRDDASWASAQKMKRDLNIFMSVLHSPLQQLQKIVTD